MDKRKEAKEINSKLSVTVQIINRETTDGENISDVMNMLMPDTNNNIFFKEINGKTLLEYISTIHNSSTTDENQSSCKLSSNIPFKVLTAATIVGIDLKKLFENISRVLDYLSNNMSTIKERYKEFITKISEKLNIISKNEKYKSCKYDNYQKFKDAIQSVNLDNNNNANDVEANYVEANDVEEKNVKYFTTILMKISNKNVLSSAYKRTVDIIKNTHTCSSAYCKEYSDCQDIALKLAAIYNVYIPNIKDVSLQSVQLAEFQKKFYSSHDYSTCAEYKNLLASPSTELKKEIEKLKKNEIHRIENLKKNEIHRIEISKGSGYKYLGKKYTKKRKLRKMKKSRSKKN